MDFFLDLHEEHLNKTGEELCGDTVKMVRSDEESILVLSDGLGSGVKANILATLTSQIIVTMLLADIPLRDVVSTVIQTLPVCRERELAYATFTVVQVTHKGHKVKIINFDNPPVMYFRNGRLMELEFETQQILDKVLRIYEGTIEFGDFIGVASDGFLHAGPGRALNANWDRDNVARFLAGVLLRSPANAKVIIRECLAKTRDLYAGTARDDATLAGIFARKRNSLVIFTGPPLDPKEDDLYVQKLLAFEGRKVVCGGTTSNLVARYLHEVIETDVSTIRTDIPPIGHLQGVELVTEGILTLSKALEYLNTSQGRLRELPGDNNGAVLLAKEILRADRVHFLVGQKISEYYQNPLLPKNISIRRSLVEDVAALLRRLNKETTIEYC